MTRCSHVGSSCCSREDRQRSYFASLEYRFNTRTFGRSLTVKPLRGLAMAARSDEQTRISEAFRSDPGRVCHKRNLGQGAEWRHWFV